MLDSFLLMLFHKYAELLKRRFSDDFQEVYYALRPVVYTFHLANAMAH